MTRIHGIQLPRGNWEDRLIWFHSTSGQLTAREAIRFLAKDQGILDWTVLIWKSFTPSIIILSLFGG